jgi:hypothetical protein
VTIGVFTARRSVRPLVARRGVFDTGRDEGVALVRRVLHPVA